MLHPLRNNNAWRLFEVRILGASKSDSISIICSNVLPLINSIHHSRHSIIWRSSHKALASNRMHTKWLLTIRLHLPMHTVCRQVWEQPKVLVNNAHKEADP